MFVVGSQCGIEERKTNGRVREVYRSGKSGWNQDNIRLITKILASSGCLPHLLCICMAHVDSTLSFIDGIDTGDEVATHKSLNAAQTTQAHVTIIT